MLVSRSSQSQGTQYNRPRTSSSARGARAGKLTERQGQDGKLEADDGSEEAFLEYAKMGAQQAFRILCLATTTMVRNPMSILGTNQTQGSRSFETCIFKVMAKLHILFLDQAERRTRKALENIPFEVMVRLRALMKHS